MYYKKYGELPRIPNEKSSSNNPVKCEYSNQLDKLESIDRLEKENLMETRKNLSCVKSENILTTQDNNELVADKTSPKFVQPAFINQVRCFGMLFLINDTKKIIYNIRKESSFDFFQYIIQKNNNQINSIEIFLLGQPVI